MTPVVAGVTLEHLLTMTGGFVDEIPQSGTFVETTLQNHLVDPGTQFRYTLGGPHLIGAILVQATGMPVLDYARAKLFDPLGIPSTPAVPSTWDGYVQDVGSDPSAFGWMVDPHGLHVGGIGLRLRAQDMAKIGLLYLNNGVWQGQQVVPAEWIQAATTAQVPVERWYNVGQGFDDLDESGYGYMWWTSHLDGDPLYWAYGAGGQKIIVIPNRDLVVVHQVDTDDGGYGSGPVDSRLQDTFLSLIAPAHT